MNKIKIIIMFGICILVLILGGIYISTNQSQDLQTNVLVVGLDDSFPPMGFRDENNEIVGFDIDLAKAVCEKLGYELELQPISWASKEQELESGNIDCIWNGLAYTEERAQTMTLSEAYIKGEMYFILPNDTTIKSQTELVGKKIGVQTGSVQELDIEASEFGQTIEIIEYSDYLMAFMDLETGGIDAVFCSSIIGNYLITTKEKDYVTIPSENISVTNGSVIAFKQGNTELRDKIQSALYELKEEGVLTQISINWFGEDMIILGEDEL